jgi:hypothetical protein
LTELRLHGENSGERGLGKPERFGANRGVSGAADDEAELTEAADTTGTQRRSQNGRETTASGDGTSWVRAERESVREVDWGATGRGE